MSERALFSAALLAATATLTGCGDGGGVASAPAPSIGSPTATSIVSNKVEIGAELPPAPATTAGTYEAIGIRNLNNASGSQTSAGSLDPSQLKLTVDPASKTYTVEFDPALFPGISVPDNKLSYTIDDLNFNHLVTQTTRLSNGTTNVSTEPRSSVVSRSITVDGADKRTVFAAITAKEKRYVSLGSWYWPQGSGRGDVFSFVYGERTLAANIPISGKATYVTGASDFLDDGSIGYNLGDANIKLTADFAARSMTADMALSFLNSFTNTLDQSSLSGTGQIAAAGNFTIPLTGVKAITAAKPDPVSGSISGAFFGPDAAQIGATFLLSHGGDPKITGAFVGVKQ